MSLTDNEVEEAGKETPSNVWPKDDADVLAHVNDCRKRSDNALSGWYEDARIDFQFAEGKQYTDEDITKLESEERVAATFNRVLPVINAILGQEVCNRQEVRYLPRREGEVSMADPMNDAVKWAREQCNAEDEDSDAFSDMVTCGMGWTVTRMDYESNADGMPVVERRDPMLMRWDASARRKNLADARFVQADYWMRPEDVEDKWPEADITTVTSIEGPTDRKQPHDATEAWKYKNDAAGKDNYNGEIRVIHHVERYQVNKWRMVDPKTNSMREYTDAEYAKIKKTAKEVGVDLPKCVRIKGRVFWEAWTVGGVVLESGEAAPQKGTVYNAMTCYRERETGYWFGVVRMMRDPQRYANRLMSLMLSILATGAKSGMLYETGAFVSPRTAKRDWAKHNSAIELTPGAIANQKVMPKPQQTMPQGAAELMQFAIASIRDVTGVNVDMLGGADRDQPGIVEDMRTKAGLTILAKVFDALRLYRKRQGILLAEFVERFISDGRLVRVLGPVGEKFIPLMRNPEATEYDVVVDESPASRDVKERAWFAIQTMLPAVMQAGIPIPKTVLDYAPIPQSLAIEWKQEIAKKEAQGPQPNPMVQAEQIKAQARLAEHQAEAASKERLAQIAAQHEQQLEGLKAQKSALTEQAQMQADIQVQNFKAQLQAQLEAAKAEYANQLDLLKAQHEQSTKLEIAQLDAATKLEVAKISKGIDADAVTVRNEVEQTLAGLMQMMQQMMEQHHQSTQSTLAMVTAPRRLVRDSSGRAVGSEVSLQ